MEKWYRRKDAKGWVVWEAELEECPGVLNTQAEGLCWKHPSGCWGSLASADFRTEFLRMALGLFIFISNITFPPLVSLFLIQWSTSVRPISQVSCKCGLTYSTFWVPFSSSLPVIFMIFVTLPHIGSFFLWTLSISTICITHSNTMFTNHLIWW